MSGKTKAQLQREKQEAEKAEAEAKAAEEKAARKKAAAEKKALEEPADTRSKAQKDRDHAGLLKQEMGADAYAQQQFNTTKTKPANIKEGLAIFDALAQDPPAKVAQWFLAQMQSVAKSGTGPESMQLYKFANAVTSATDAQRQKVIKNAISGYGEMETIDRAEVLKLVVRSASASQPPKAGQRESQHVTNLRAIIKAAKFETMLAKDREALLVVTQATALQFANPVNLSQALMHLNPEDRKELTRALVQLKFIPADQAPMLEEIIQPEGIMDEVGTASTAASQARELVYIVVVLPPVEWICARSWADPSDCANSLAQWLHSDACLSMATILFLLIAYKLLMPAYDVIVADPAGFMRRWRSSAGEPLDARLQNSVRIGAVSYKLGLGAALFAVFLSLLSGAYSLWALWLLMRTTLMEHCYHMTVVFEAIVITLRVVFISAVLYVFVRLVLIYRRNNKMVDAPGYGSVDNAA